MYVVEQPITGLPIQHVYEMATFWCLQKNTQVILFDKILQ